MSKNKSTITYKRADYIIEKVKSGHKKKSKKSGKRKRGNGRGTVEHTKNSQNPYTAKVPVGTYTGKHGKLQTKYKSIGSFPTKGLALDALNEYNRTPYDLSSKIKTFEDLYKVWSKEYFSTLSNDSSVRTITSAYAYCNGLYYMNIRKIGPGHIKDSMKHGYVIETRGKNKGKKKYASPNTQARMKSLCNLMFDYALERNLVLTNPARAFKIDQALKKEIEENTKKKKPFSEADVKLLWEYLEIIPIVDMILIGIYTGFRPQELTILRTDNVHLKENYMIGGMKSDNGTDRIVPIHPKIKDLVEFRYLQAKKYQSKYLFNLPVGNASKCFTYDTYENRFHDVMEMLDLEDFTPHCTRHTFATQAEECGLRDRAIKLIMGHSLKGNVTEQHYKHTGIAYLYKEICKLTFERGEDDADIT